ncbi:MAG: hypothetical protein Q9157_001812 [Trypethelium eluteriae]
MWRREMQHHAGPRSAYNPAAYPRSSSVTRYAIATPSAIEGVRQVPYLENNPNLSHRRKSHRLALKRASYFLFLLSVLLFLALAFNLAFPRFSPRLSNIVSQFAPSASKARPAASRPLSNVSMAPARYQHPPQPPPCFTATPKSLIEETKQMIARNKKVQDDIVRDVKPAQATFENTLLKMAREDDYEGLESHIIGFYQAISTDKTLRDASTEAEKLMDQFAIDS